MSPNMNPNIKDVLSDSGFTQEGHFMDGFMDVKSVQQSTTSDLRYADILNSKVHGVNVADYVYEIPSYIDNCPGAPCIYFKISEHPDPETIVEMRQVIWNQGRAPLFWLITTDMVRIYDSFARPQDGDDERSHLLAELQRIGQHVEGIQQFHKMLFDTGKFWSSEYGQKVLRDQRVDIAMLEDLSLTESFLRDAQLPITFAHSLLGRAIFASYLQDRNILKSTFLLERYEVESFSQLLGDKEKTYAFFEWLRDTFNGDLFPLSYGEKDAVNTTHLELIRLFLNGADLRFYPRHVQQRIWPYRFDIIPIELISSIYEMFAHNINLTSAEANSVHYTKVQLVELMINFTMSNLATDARILDPSCGSGVFLVEAFRFLARKSSRQLERPLQRSELHKILLTQIFGIDVDSDAIRVAAFSLYLTLLELDPDPQPPEALKFPYLVFNEVNHSDENGHNLFVADFCDSTHTFNKLAPFANKGLDLVIGNAPWTALKLATAPRDPKTGRQWGLEYCINHSIPDKKPDLAFLTRIRDFVTPKSQIALIVCSRLFYQESDKPLDKRWLSNFMKFNSIQTVFNFSDLVTEDVLFGGRTSTRLPASVIFFTTQFPLPHQQITYICPKWYPGIEKRGEIVINNGDIQKLLQQTLYENPFLWKTAFRGTGRDFKLLRRIQKFSSLRDVLFDARIKQMGYGLTFGKKVTKDASMLKDAPFLESKSHSRYAIDVDKLNLFRRDSVAQKSNRLRLKLPVLILYRSLIEYQPTSALIGASTSRSDLVYDHMYYGISFKGADWLAYRMNAIFNSRLSLYLLFMFSSALGWDRRLIEPTDWLQIKLPPSILNEEDHNWDRLYQLEAWLRQNGNAKLGSATAKQIREVEDQLNRIIYSLYGLTEQEIIQVEDTLRFNIELFLKRRKGTVNYSKPLKEHLERYAARVCSQLDGILNSGNLELTATIIDFKADVPLSICRFTEQERNIRRKIRHVALNNVDSFLGEIADNLRFEVANNIFANADLRVYQGNSFWVIKRAERRFWNEAAALVDADSILQEHMESAQVG